MTIAIIDYGSGNLRSVAKAFEHVATNHSVLVTNNPRDIEKASHIVLPGVGAFADCMAGLKALPYMVETLTEQVIQKKKNFLGICVGMQMMFERGLEHGEHVGLGWLKGEVVKITTQNSQLKIPHMGWNELTITREHTIMKGIQNGDHAYFVHSYHAKAKPEDVIATTDYGKPIAAVVGCEHMIGTQFHPEKSQASGLALLANFVKMLS